MTWRTIGATFLTLSLIAAAYTDSIKPVDLIIAAFTGAIWLTIFNHWLDGGTS